MDTTERAEPMKGLADFLRAKANTANAVGNFETADCFSLWASEVEAARQRPAAQVAVMAANAGWAQLKVNGVVVRSEYGGRGLDEIRALAAACNAGAAQAGYDGVTTHPEFGPAIARAAAQAASAEPENRRAEHVLADRGVFKGHHGLRGLAESQEFWDQQPYGTRLYYGNGIADYLHRGVLRSAVEALDEVATPTAERPAAPAPQLPDVEDALRAVPGLDEQDIQALLGMVRVVPEFAANLRREREAFEKWADGVGFNIHRDESDKYLDYHRVTTRWAWQAWQARAVLQASPSQPAVQGVDAQWAEKICGVTCSFDWISAEDATPTVKVSFQINDYDARDAFAKSVRAHLNTALGAAKETK